MNHKENLIRSLELNISIFERFISLIPESNLHTQRGDGLWTLYEHIYHLAMVQPMLFRRLRQFVREEAPVIHAFTPDPEEDQKEDAAEKPVAEILKSFSSWRKKQVDLLRSCDSSVWEREGKHPEYSEYPFEVLVTHILAHDGFHLYRIEELWLVSDQSLTKM